MPSPGRVEPGTTPRGSPAQASAHRPGAPAGEFAQDYLFTFYSAGPTPDEEAVLDFLVRHYPRIPPRAAMIEIGCGPTVHHSLPAVPYVGEVHLADHLGQNLECVRAWREGRADAHDWSSFTALTLRLEGTPASPPAIRRREQELRAKITALLPCDLRQDLPLGGVRQYPVVGCFYCTEVVGCTEAAAATLDDWRGVMRRLAGVVAPGGHLFLSAIKESAFYALYSPGARPRRLPTVCLTERDLRETLPELGFDMDRTVIESRDFRGQEAEGLHGVILVAGQKRA